MRAVIKIVVPDRDSPVTPKRRCRPVDRSISFLAAARASKTRSEKRGKRKIPAGFMAGPGPCPYQCRRSTFRQAVHRRVPGLRFQKRPPPPIALLRLRRRCLAKGLPVGKILAPRPGRDCNGFHLRAIIFVQEDVCSKAAAVQT
jgi:hypothetical protein